MFHVKRAAGSRLDTPDSSSSTRPGCRTCGRRSHQCWRACVSPVLCSGRPIRGGLVWFHVKRVPRRRRSAPMVPGRSGRPAPLPGRHGHGILRPEVAAVRPSLEGSCGRVRPWVCSPRTDSLDDPAPRRGRCDGDGLARTDRRAVPAGRRRRNRIWSSSSGSSSRSRVGLEAASSGPSWEASSSMCSLSGRSGRPRSRCSSAWVRPPSSPAFRPLPPARPDPRHRRPEPGLLDDPLRRASTPFGSRSRSTIRSRSSCRAWSTTPSSPP